MLNHQVYPAPGRADAPPGQTVLAGTRRQLTVLCCDVRDVTSLSGSPLDPEDLPAMLHTVDEVYAPLIGRSGGILVSSTGEVLWAAFGYPQASEDAAVRAVRAALELARSATVPHNLAFALNFCAIVHQFRQEGPETQARAEEEIALATEQGFPHWLAAGTRSRGWALAAQGLSEEGIAQLRQGLADYQATGAGVGTTYVRALRAEAYGHMDQPVEGLQVLAEALADAAARGAGTRGASALCLGLFLNPSW